MINLGPLGPLEIIDTYPLPKNGEHFAFAIPGIAYIDGRDLSATPPLTASKINLWNGPNQAKIVGYLYHGQKVQVTEARQHNERWFFKVRRPLGTRLGWVSEYMLSDADYAPVGEMV